MRFPCFFLLMSGLLFAQAEVPIILYKSPIIALNPELTTVGDETFIDLQDEFTYQIERNPDGSKTFKFLVQECTYPPPAYVRFRLGPDSIAYIEDRFKSLEMGEIGVRFCTQYSASDALGLGIVQAALSAFNSKYANATRHKVYGPFSRQPSADAGDPQSAIVQPAPPVDPLMILLDAVSNRGFKFYVTTFAINP